MTQRERHALVDALIEWRMLCYLRYGLEAVNDHYQTQINGHWWLTWNKEHSN